jgi:hypothetical protein
MPQSDVESIYEVLVQDASAKPRRSIWRLTKSESWVVLLALTCLVLGWITVAAHMLRTGLVFLLISELLGFVMVCWGTIKELPNFSKFFKSIPLKASLEFLSGKTDADYSVATRLLVFDKAALGFVAKRFRSEADHLRVRGGVLVAPIDKIGLAPVFASIALTIWKLAKEFPIPYWVFMLLAGYSFWCFICVLGISHSQRYEELAQIIDLAVEMKNQSPEAYRASS